MEKKNYRVWAWEWILWKKAIHDTIAFYQTNKLASVGNLVGSILTLFFLILRGGIQVINDQLLLIEATLFGFIGTGVFYIIVNRMSAPLVLYRKRESESFRKTWKDVEIEKYSFPPEYGIGIGLRIISDKPKHFDNLNGDVGIGNITPEVVKIIQRGINKDIAQSRLPFLSKTVRGFQPVTGISNREHEKNPRHLTVYS